MFPTRSMYDYMSEINRLFPETPRNAGGNDFHNLPSLLGHHPLTPQHQTMTPQQPAPANQSSSSADSLSPDYPDGPFRRRETPVSRLQRPIVGRKIMGNAEQQHYESPSKPTSGSFDSGFDSSPVKSGWQPEEYSYNVTPKSNFSGSRYVKNESNFNGSLYVQNESHFSGSRYVQNAYELFPERNQAYDFKTPLLSNAQFNPKTQNVPSTQNSSPLSPKYNLAPNRPPPTTFLPTNFTQRSPLAAAHFPSNPQGDGMMCTFCRKNGETPVVYLTHTVRTRVGNKSIVSCPILRSHICSMCGESGDNAHTITYCPVMRSHNNGLPLQSTTITLKNTRIKSNGRRRF